MNMLKLFFVFATLTTLVKSEIAVEWICEDTRQMGNCSTIPKITDLLQMISENYEYPDIYFCPFNIVERHTKCMYSYLYYCHTQINNDLKQNILEMYNKPLEDSKNLCTKRRSYRKEFIEHVSCSKAVLKADRQWQNYVDQQKLEIGQSMENMELDQKCLLIWDYWHSTNMYIRTQCGIKTEKFHRQVLGNMWPLSLLIKLCNDLSTYGS
ncbi:uncharacterized protein LOC113557451 [Rhopalosiphum maidis]|uniref:uncharacterized protein LOC113557451 n=1 Tax=Rhopalosiphum maidis TaxID=43146 RepID=UPI000F000ED9|nr:uncharacterized protein LOC113557451 [Rhopalosiphum maidis]